MLALLKCRAGHVYRAQPLRLSVAYLHWSRFARQEATANSTLDDDQNAAIFSFGARVNANLDLNLLKKCITHKTLTDEDNNGAFHIVGKRIASIVTLEHLHCKYPDLHSEALDKIMRAYIGGKSIAQIGNSTGLNHIIRWQPAEPELEEQSPVWFSTALADCMNAVIGAIYLQHGHETAKKFIHAHILSRDLDLRPFVKVDQPKRHLTILLKKLDMQPAISRLLSETGRHSNAPTFVVGVFSDDKKLGEGFGSSMKMAEYRACQDALYKHYGKEQKDFTLPSDADNVDHYTPPVLGNTQAII